MKSNHELAQAYLDDPRHMDGNFQPRWIMDDHFGRCRDEAVAMARECLLDLVADARRFDEDIDGDETGQTITYFIETGHSQLAELAEVLGIHTQWGETIGDCLRRIIEHSAAELADKAKPLPQGQPL